jgi:hypothetical protein
VFSMRVWLDPVSPQEMCGDLQPCVLLMDISSTFIHHILSPRLIVAEIIICVMNIRNAISSVIKTFQQTQPFCKTFEAFIKPETLTSDIETWRQKKQA